MTGFPRVVAALIRDRSAGVCEVCGLDYGEQLHHRRPRAMGSSKRPDTNLASNGLHVSMACHALIESRRELALDRGWLVRQTCDPADVPVLRLGVWVLLQPSGGVFVPPRGRGRCGRCGVHEGHRQGCQVA